MRAAWHDVWNLIHDEGEELKIEGIWRDSEDQVYEGMALDIDAAEIQERGNLLGVMTRESRMRESGMRAIRRDALNGARAEKSWGSTARRTGPSEH